MQKISDFKKGHTNGANFFICKGECVSVLLNIWSTFLVQTSFSSMLVENL